MVVGCSQRSPTSEKLFRFLQENSYIGLKLRLLLFFVRHSHARFSLDSVASALEATKASLKQALTASIETGVLKEQYHGSGVTSYCLSSDDQTQELIDELARLDWSEIGILERQLRGEAVAA